MPEETVGSTERLNCECGPCRKRKGMSHNVHPGVIHEYTSVPRGGWRARRTTAEMTEAVPAPTFGIELETSAPRYRVTDLPNRPYMPSRPYTMSEVELVGYERLRREATAWIERNDRHRARSRERFAAEGNMTADEAVSVAEPVGLWHPKHDGSVTGPEFASQPCTLAYWRAHRPAVTAMFRALLHGGMRSHDGDSAGMHVNIGSDAFANGEHLERFMALIATNPRWTTRMSQRTHQSMLQWANFDQIGDASRRASFARNWERDGEAGTYHSSAVNLAHRGRVEFRIPRGTLRVDRFYAKIEWTAAMLEFTRSADNATTPTAFTTWVQDRATDYPELLAFMRERFAGRFAEEVVSA